MTTFHYGLSSIGILLGNLFLHSLPVLPSHKILFGLFFLFLSIFLFKLNHISVFLLTFITGFFYTALDARHYIHQKLAYTSEDKNIEIIGKISTLPYHDGQNFRFNFDIEKILKNNPGLHLQHIKLFWKTSKNSEVKPGQTWRFLIKIRPVHGFYNPGSIDTERIAFVHNIQATGVVIPSSFNHKIDSSLSKICEQFRYFIFKKLQIFAFKYNEILIALAVGVSDEITSKDLDVFSKTGTAHLLAISGLHIGLAAGFGFLLIKLIWKKFPHLCLKYPVHQTGSVAAILFAFLYSVCAGFSISTQRAFIMITLWMGAKIFNIYVQPFQILCFALMLCLGINPRISLLPGFWLSFGAVFILILSSRKQIFKKSPLSKFISPQYFIFIGMIPVTLLIFNQYSLISFLANLIAIPWFSFLVVPFVLVGVLFLSFHLILVSKMFIFLGSYSVGLIFPLLKWLSHLSFSTLSQFVPLNILFLIFNIFIIWLLLPSIFPGRGLASFAFLSIFFNKSPKLPLGTVQINQLDIGQGLAVFIKTANHVLLYDTGTAFKEMDSGKAVILPFLIKEGIKKIDSIIISHGDLDHRGGLTSIIEKIKVKEVITSIPKILPVKNALDCHFYKAFDWDGVHFQFMPLDIYDRQRNNHSCVLKISTGKYAALLTGDIEKQAEEKLMLRYGTGLLSTLLFAPHHGSKTSSSKNFIEAVNASYIFYATGFHNRYKFPHKEVIERYNKKGAKGYNSADSGMLEVSFNASGFSVPQAYRNISPHYWLTNI